MIVYKEFTFEASHILPEHPGKCKNLHGHSWKMIVAIEGPIHDRTGFVCDYSMLKGLVDLHLISKLDHSHLGCGEARVGMSWFSPYFGLSFYPSSENLCRAIFKLLCPLVKELAPDVELYSIEIKETCTSGAVYARADEVAA